MSGWGPKIRPFLLHSLPTEDEIATHPPGAIFLTRNVVLSILDYTKPPRASGGVNEG